MSAKQIKLLLDRPAQGQQTVSAVLDFDAELDITDDVTSILDVNVEASEAPTEIVPKHKSFTLGELAKATNTEVIGNSDCHINKLSTIDNASEGSITFLTNQKNTYIL